ncbi:flippase [Methanocorpusculum sp. MG]|uniref:Flippase n=1 Tax=Methanocorpusculum petauri TaxID=3002863 RepID=A0ABT4IGD5_9EURY|nr:flippase [Methanocorpusculum petauri]MCZ0860810.1 flippase [Methanocorpusculum petauri]MDE2443299.1 flippase [Methanocorpusculum sp.]
MPSHIVNRISGIPPIQRQSMIQLGVTIAVTLFGFASTMLFSHILGKDLMGVYYLFLAYYGVFNMIGDAGFGGAAVKRISEGNDQNEYLTAYATLRFLLIIVSTLILLAVSPYFVDLKEYELVPWIIAALAAAFFGGTITMGVYGLGHVGIRNLATGVNEFVRILIQIIAVLLGYSVAGLFGGFIIAIIISGIFCLKYFTFRPARFTTRHLKSLITYSLWIFLIGSGSLIFSYADTIFIGYFMENGDVGVYRVALQLTTAGTFITAAIAGTLTPKFSNWSAKGDLTQIPGILTRSITYGLLLAVPTAAGGILLSERLLYFFYGADFAVGGTACAILLLLQIVNVFMVFLGTTLSAIDHARQSFYASGSAAVLNVVLNVLLIPVIGIEGAAVASLVSITLNAVLLRHYLKHYIDVRCDLHAASHIVFSAVLMAAFIFIYKQLIPLTNVFLVLIPVAVGAVIYFVVLFKLDKGIHDEIAGLAKQFGLPWPRWL